MNTIGIYPLPATGFLKLSQIIGDPKAKPPIPALIPVSRATWANGCKSGLYPKPIRIAPRLNGWRVQDILKLIEEIGRAEEQINTAEEKQA